MKRIYAVTLDNDDYPSSDRFRSNVRLIAYLLYDLIYNYDGENFTALIINSKIKNNNIHEGNGYGEYYLDYNEYNEKYINYEPFLIGERSFALTIDDEIMSEDVIYELMEQVLILIRISYRYEIKSIGYDSRDKEDERNRKKAVYQLCELLEDSTVKKNINAKKRILVNSLIKKRIGLF